MPLDNPLPIEVPIYLSASFQHPLPDGNPNLTDRGTELKYSREENPTVRYLEHKVAKLEGLKDGLAFNSGMAAISTLLISRGGRGILVGIDAYATTVQLALDLRELGFQVKIVAVDELPDNITREYGLILLESLTNPMLRVPDIPAIGDRSEEVGAELAIDNTFTPPEIFRPAKYGAKFVLHSATKYLSGHNDIIAGLTLSDNIEEQWEWRRKLGAILDPIRAFMLIRGLYTLQFRIRRHSETALEVAKFLEEAKGVKEVRYPGLESDPYHKRAKDLFGSLYGGVVTFKIEGDVFEFFKSLKVIKPAPSLGAPTSLVTFPLISSARGLPEEMLESLGIDDSTVRLSVGLEDPQQIIQDLEEALKSSTR